MKSRANSSRRWWKFLTPGSSARVKRNGPRQNAFLSLERLEDRHLLAGFTVSADDTSLLTPASAADEAVLSGPRQLPVALDGLTIAATRTSRAAQVQASASAASMQVSGKDGAAIQNGSVEPTAANGTDYGLLALRSPSIHTFSIANTDAFPLVLRGKPRIGGLAAQDFKVVRSPATTIAPGGVTTFDVSFAPRLLGTRPATVIVRVKDTLQSQFTFAVQGEGGLAQLGVAGSNESPVFDGAKTANLTTGTDWGLVALGATSNQYFKLTNHGAANLDLTKAVKVSGSGARSFTVMQPSDSSLAPGESTTLKLMFTPQSLSRRSATVTIYDNDFLNKTYTFAIRGRGVASQVPFAASPGTIETITIPKEVSVDPMAMTSLVLTNSRGQQVDMRGVRVETQNGVRKLSFAVPVFFNPETLEPAAGELDARLKQESPSGVVSVGLGSLPILELPETGLPPGALTTDFITRSLQLLTTQSQALQSIGQTGNIDVSAVLAEYQGMVDQLQAILQGVADIQSGAVPQLAIGELNGREVLLDVNSLALLDQTIAGIVLNSGLGDLDASDLHATSFAFGDFAVRTDSFAVQVSGFSDPRGALDNFFQNIKSVNRSDLPRIYDKIGTIAGVVAAGAGLAILAGATAPALALTYLVATDVALAAPIASLAVTALNQGIITRVLDGTYTKQEFSELVEKYREQKVDEILDDGIEVVSKLVPNKPAGQALKFLLEGAKGVHDLMAKDSVAESIIHQVDAKFEAIRSALSDPTIDATPGSLSFIVTNGADAPPPQVLTVSNVGHGALNYSVSSSLSQIHVSAGSNQLPAGQSDSLDVTVDSTGLEGGEYDESITISDPLATNQAVTVSVHITMLVGVADVSPLFQSLEAKEGEAAVGELTVHNIGHTETILHYSIDASDPRVSVVGQTVGIPASFSDELSLSIDTTGLEPSSTPYAFQVFVTNTDLAADDPDRVTVANVEVLVTPAEAGEADVSPVFQTLQTAPGAPARGQLTLSNVGPEETVLHYSISTSDPRVSVSGQSGGIPSGQSDNLNLTVDTTGLAVSVYSFQVFITNSDVAVDHPNRVTVAIVLVDVSRPAAVIAISPQNISVSCPAGSSLGPIPVRVFNVGPPTSILNWEVLVGGFITSSDSQPISGGSFQDIQLFVDTLEGLLGTFPHLLIFFSTDDSGRVQETSITVTVNVT